MLSESVLPAYGHDEGRGDGMSRFIAAHDLDFEEGWSGMIIKDWFGGALWALPVIAAFEYLTR